MKSKWGSVVEARAHDQLEVTINIWNDTKSVRKMVAGWLSVSLDELDDMIKKGKIWQEKQTQKK